MEFYRELERVKALSVITARQEEDQRKNISSRNVPVLKPPPRPQKQQLTTDSSLNFGVSKPKVNVRKEVLFGKKQKNTMIIFYLNRIDAF